MLTPEREAELRSLGTTETPVAVLWEDARDLLAECDRLRAENASLWETLNRIGDERQAFCYERNEARAENAALREAIAWALGESGNFPPREDGEGAYWWRTELRKRARWREVAK